MFIYHSSFLKDTDLRKCIPLILHGDDCESHRRRSFTVCSFASLLVKNCSVWDNRLLCYCTDNSRSCNETVDTLDAWLVHSLTELMMGRFFEIGPFGDPIPGRENKGGQEIAGGYRGILTVHRGDEKYLVKAYHLTISWLSQRCCWSCHASRMSNSELLFTHFGPNAQHRQTLVGTAEFIQSCKPNAWVNLPGWHVEVVSYDFLHVFDLTLVPDAAASVFLLHSNFTCVHVCMLCACDFPMVFEGSTKCRNELRLLWNYHKRMKYGKALYV